MEEEIRALIKNQTWEKCKIPKGKKVVGRKWVFTIKYKSDRMIELEVQSSPGCKRVHSNIWDRLLLNVLTSSKD